MTTGPHVRARATNDLIAFLDVYRPGLEAEVRERMPSAALEVIEAVAAVDWISIEQTHHLVDAIVGILGPAQASELWAEFLQQRMITSPLLRTFTEAGLRLFQATPLKLFGLLPRAWETAHRGFCKLRVVSVADGQAVVALDDIAPSVFEYSNYFVALEGVFRGLLRWARGADAQVTLETDAESSSGVARATWSRSS